MKYIQAISILLLVCLMANCSKEKLEEKGFQVGTPATNSENKQADGINRNLLKIDSRPGSVLLTGIPDIRLTTVYKVNINKNDNSTFIGSNNFYYTEEETDETEKTEKNKENNWNNNLMPGLETVYGYNMINISHYNISLNRQKNFFEKPVLIKNLYYPAFSKDTLNYKPVNRNYFMVSVYNDDTNKDGFVNIKDLRRLYLFDINGEKQKALIPENYSVLKSEYDPGNDFMFVFATFDSNKNGRKDENEPVHIFWVDLKDPNKTGRQY